MTRPFLVSGLAALHLRHEWILTLCLVIALAAVIAPLLVLLGLKHGTIATLRERLVEDPVFREIRPAQTREFTADWFTNLRSRPDVGFLTPTILPLSSVISVLPAQTDKTLLFDLIPTAQGDPLLLENTGVIPNDGEAVLTAEAARRAGVRAGEEILVQANRFRGGQNETVQARLRVAAVLAPRAGSLARLYAPLSFVLDVEGYKEGYAAPARGWSGATPDAYPSFDGAVLLLPAPLDPIVRTGLIIGTGFGRIAEISAEKTAELLGFAPPAHLTAYDLSAPGATVTASNLRAIEQKLRGQTKVLLPYALDVGLKASDQTMQPIGLSLDAEQAALLGLPALPWGGLDASQNNQAGRLTQVLWPQARTGHIQVMCSGSADLTFPLHMVGQTALARPVVPVELTGVLRTAALRKVRFDQESERFEMARSGYRGFRLYATTIDAIPTLHQWFTSQGIETLAEVESIQRIQTLDQGLSRLFRLIALLGLFGGTAVLVASLYAAVERRRRDLGVLRLLGFARIHVFFFPVAQGLILAALGLGAGFAGYAALSATINQTFASELAPGEAFCVLPGAYLPVFCLITFALAALASLVAAWRATCIDPAEVLREN